MQYYTVAVGELKKLEALNKLYELQRKVGGD